MDLLWPEVGQAAVALLEDAGVEVSFPEGQTCCGQPAFNSGYFRDARRVAGAILESLEGAGAIVCPSGSCTSMVRNHLPALFAGTKDEARALDVAGRTYELIEFLVDVLHVEAVHGKWEGRVTYHDSCHGLRELDLRAQGRALLQSVNGLELVEMSGADICCGFGGAFSMRLPDLATAMADDKLARGEATRANVMVMGDVGCLVHLAGRLSRRGSSLKAMHLATLLAEARGLVARDGRDAVL